MAGGSALGYRDGEPSAGSSTIHETDPRARVARPTSRGFVLDCGDGVTMRIVALADDLVRRHAAARRRGAAEAHLGRPRVRRGRHGLGGPRRLDDSSWPAVATDIAESPSACRAGDRRASAWRSTLDPLRMDWALPDGTVFAAGPRDPALFPRPEDRTRSGTRWRAVRATATTALGDKTGPLDLTGRRLRLAMRDALGFDPERGDPLYKNWPFLIVRDGPSGGLARALLRQRRRGRVRSRLRARQLLRPLSVLRGRGRRPRLLSDPRAAAAGRHAENSSR